MAKIGILIRYRRPWIALLARPVARIPFCGRLAIWMAVCGGGLEIRTGGKWQAVEMLQNEGE